MVRMRLVTVVRIFQGRRFWGIGHLERSERNLQREEVGGPGLEAIRDGQV